MANDDFRRGMLYGFAATGLNPSEVGELILQLEKHAGSAIGAADKLTELAAGAAVGVPLFTGVLGGAAAYNLFGPNYKANAGALRQQDIINEIRQRRRDVERTLGKKGLRNARAMAAG